MSETIGEMIIPGTYIEVRAEGLIGVGGISTGNIGVVGTANRGPLEEVVILGSYAEALQTFGRYDPWPENPATTPHLTLTRTLEQLFAGGASTVHAVRVANLAEDVEMHSMSWTVLADDTVRRRKDGTTLEVSRTLSPEIGSQSSLPGAPMKNSSVCWPLEPPRANERRRKIR